MPAAATAAAAVATPLPAAATGCPFAAADLGLTRQGIDKFLAAYLEKERIAAAHHPAFDTLYDDLIEFVCRPGKRLRPLLFLLSHQAFCSTEKVERFESSVAIQKAGDTQAPDSRPSTLNPSTDLLAIAASLELLHAFILIHDDIIDRSETRRALPTLHRVVESRLTPFSDRPRVGANLALVLGDVLFALAQKCLLHEPHGVAPELRLRLGALLLGCMVETGFGEAADIVHGTRDVSKVSLGDIETMYLLKTTRYTIECPLVMAALLSRASEAELAQLAHVAQPAGLAFQIQNDLQEFARFEVSDAAVPADILEGKKTLLIRTAFAQLAEPDQGLLQLCLSGASPSEGSVTKARELVVKSGAVARLGATMETLFAKAESAARNEVFRLAVREGLVALIRLVRGAAAGCSDNG